jgi:hypothetical protein
MIEQGDMAVGEAGTIEGNNGHGNGAAQGR